MTRTAHDAAMGALWRSSRLREDFLSITGFGGRFAGSDSELAARAWLRRRLAGIEGPRLSEHVYAYEGWRRGDHRLEVTGDGACTLPCHSLVWSPDTSTGGLEAEVVDLGQGHRAAFEQAGEAIRGRFVLVRQDYPFATETVHRMVKYRWALEFGAVGMLLANARQGQLLATGFSSPGGAGAIPSAGLSQESAARAAGRRVRLHVRGERFAGEGADLIAEVPGQGEEWVVLSAHYDGHDLAESALDNATGVAGALAILEAFAPHVGRLRRGLRVMFFTTEEWGLMGSRLYVDGLPEAERRRIAVDINLDTIAGSPHLSALTSGFLELEEFVARAAAETGTSIGIVRPPKRNSDHYNFARRGIPALRLVAGFDEPDCRVGWILSPADTADKAPMAELKHGTMVAAELAWRALTHEGPVARHMGEAEARALVAHLE